MWHSSIRCPTVFPIYGPDNLRRRTGMSSRSRTKCPNSARICEHKSASNVPIYNLLFPIAFGIVARPEGFSPRPTLRPSSSWKAKQILASGNVEVSGEISANVFSNCSEAVDSGTEDEQAAMPMMPRLKCEGLKRDNGEWACRLG